MIVDTSAIVAVLRRESEADEFLDLLLAGPVRMSAVSWTEAAVVVDSLGDPVLSGRFDDLLALAAVAVVPVSEDQARAARQAYRDFGKGRHPAGLNFGDCFAYALARLSGEPLLFKGNDFALTDVRPACRA